MSQAVYQDRYVKAEMKRVESGRELLGYHLAGINRWLFAHRRSDSHPFFMIYGSSPQPYYTDLHDCTCDSHQKGRVACKHMLAVRMWFEAYKLGEISLPTTATRSDMSLIAEASAIAEAVDVAMAADCLLDQYDAAHPDQAHSKPVPSAEAVDWWMTDEGAPVWLRAGDTYAPDTLVPAPVPAGELAACNNGPRVQAMIDRLAAEDRASGVPERRREDPMLTFDQVYTDHEDHL